MLHVARSTLPVLLVVTRSLGAQQSLPPLPDTTGFGVHVLALARAPDNALWVGTYGQGIFVLRPGAGSWEQIKHSSDTTGRTICFDFVHASVFGRNGAIWYGTVGSGWGLSTDGGRTWTEFPTPVRCAPPGEECVNRVRGLAPDTGSLMWVGTERGLYRLDPTRSAWLDKRGNPACPVAPVVKSCRVDLPPVQAVVRGGPAQAFAATRDGVYAEDGDALNVCDMTRSVSAVWLLAPGVYAAGRPTGGSTCRLDPRLTLVGVTYQERPDTDSHGTRHKIGRAHV